MNKALSFRQKLGGAFALLLSLILLHGAIGWVALQEYNNLSDDMRVIDQIVEMTLRAHMNEKNYILTGERYSAIIVQEELEKAQELVNQILPQKTSLEKSILQDMFTALDIYKTTFSQYVIYEDQHRALGSEGQRLTEDLFVANNELRQISEKGMDEDLTRINWLLLVHKSDLQVNENKYILATGDVNELTTLVKKMEQQASNPKTKLASYRVTTILEEYLEVVNKIKALEKLQRSNESKMAAAAEEVQRLDKVASTNQQESVKKGQLFTMDMMIIVFLLSIGIAIWGTFYLSRRLTRPLQDLVAITSSLGKGHFNTRIEVEGDDEFHSLLISINQMAENIADLSSNMEQLVEERTKDLEIEKFRFQKLFENNPEGILIFNEEMRVLAVNNAFTAIFGYTPPEIINSKLQDFLLVDNEHNGEYPREETLRRCKNGMLISVSITRYSFQQLGGKNLHYAIYTDISEQKAVEKRLHFLSFHDSLTTLKNRTYFELEMERLQQSGEACGIIVCDVDGLKIVNDNWGHGAGDQLLKDAAQVLMEVAGTKALARVGGDEFVIFLPGGSEEETYNMATTIAAQLENRKNEKPYPLMISVGHAYRCNDLLSMEELFSLADKRMYVIKKQHHICGSPIRK